MTRRHHSYSMELGGLVLALGLMTFTFTVTFRVAVGDELPENVTMTADDAMCEETNCSSNTQNTTLLTPDFTTEEACLNYSSGWGLKGSDWGCCGNYEGCCTYASLICYFHDAMCRCCDVSETFCGPACKPEPDCEVYNVGNNTHTNVTQSDVNPEIDVLEVEIDEVDKSDRNATKYVNKNDKDASKYEEFVRQNVNRKHHHTNHTGKNEIVELSMEYNETNKTENETAQVASFTPETKRDYLDIEALERTLNDTKYNSNEFADFDLDIEKLLNETEALLNQHDEIFEEYGSGELEFKAEI